jgi:hypothetical protein
MCCTRLPLALLTVLVASVVCQVILSQSASAQEPHCDQGLRQSDSDPYAYKLRGDRCEGIYIRKVAGSTFVASFTESFENFDPNASQNLLLEWTPPSKASVHLRAYSLRQKAYYRMDSVRPPESTSYAWPPNLLSTLNLRKKDLGVVAWISKLAGDQDVYLPLRIKQNAVARRTRSYQLILFPGEELSQIFISLAPVKPDGSTGAFIVRDSAQGGSYLPAERAITIEIPELTQPGVYSLELGATLRAGGSWTTKFLFYHHN